MPDLDKLKEIDVFELHKLIDYMRSIIVWKQRPEMYLEPMPYVEGDNWGYKYVEEESENNATSE